MELDWINDMKKETSKKILNKLYKIQIQIYFHNS